MDGWTVRIRAGRAEVEIQACHQAERLVRETDREVLVGGVLQAAGIGMQMRALRCHYQRRLSLRIMVSSCRSSGGRSMLPSDMAPVGAGRARLVGSKPNITQFV